MKIYVSETPQALGRSAARRIASALRETLMTQEAARLVLSTGASQFTTLAALVREELDWERVEMFHLDEYVGLSPSHPASFRRYLQERFVSKLSLKRVCWVDGEGDVESKRALLCAAIAEAPVDVGVIGVGENAHIAFNDPPADFDACDPYIIVTLNDTCKAQQVREGWFPDADAVPPRAVSMSVRQVLRCKTIICPVPYRAKAQAVQKMLTAEVSPAVPASILREHATVHLYLDRDSASLCAL